MERDRRVPNDRWIPRRTFLAKKFYPLERGCVRSLCVVKCAHALVAACILLSCMTQRKNGDANGVVGFCRIVHVSQAGDPIRAESEDLCWFTFKRFGAKESASQRIRKGEQVFAKDAP